MNKNFSPKSLLDPLYAASSWHSEGKQVAIARVLSTWGSSPRPAGSLLTINEDSSFAGSVSGGCIEGAVIKEALEVMKTGKSQILEFGITQDQAWEVGLACGGQIEILIERMDSKIVEALLAERDSRRPIVWLTNLATSSHSIIHIEQTSSSETLDTTNLETIAKQSLKMDRSHIVTCDSNKVFINSFNPQLRLIIIGAVHIAQHLAPMAACSGYEVIIIDPRRSFATNERFPDAVLINDWPDDALQQIPLDPKTAIVTLTHDPKLDESALSIALNSTAFYIGSLGSKKTQQSRLKRLAENSFSKTQLERIHGPIGLDLGGRSPAEISIAILAEITQKLRKDS